MAFSDGQFIKRVPQSGEVPIEKLAQRWQKQKNVAGVGDPGDLQPDPGYLLVRPDIVNFEATHLMQSSPTHLPFNLATRLEIWIAVIQVFHGSSAPTRLLHQQRCELLIPV